MVGPHRPRRSPESDSLRIDRYVAMSRPMMIEATQKSDFACAFADNEARRKESVRIEADCTLGVGVVPTARISSYRQRARDKKLASSQFSKCHR